MKEAPGPWGARTHLRYAPPAWLLARGRTLAEDEACPTLFRSPGAEALLAFLGGGLPSLGAPGSPAVWAPPSALARDLDWDGVQTESEARALLGLGWAEERREVEERLRHHLGTEG